MLITRDGRDLIVCDDPLCDALVEAAHAENGGWLITSVAGPHYCPYGTDWRFRSLIDRVFGPSPA